MGRPPSRSLALVVLAAGRGKRMRSTRPKVLHEVCGRPALWFVLRAGAAARPARTVVVVGQGRDRVEEAVRSWELRPAPVFVEQGEPLGTAHAVAAAEEATAGVDDVLVMAGDDPLVTADHIRQLLRVHRRTGAAATVLTTPVDDSSGYARVVREGHRLVDLVVEDVADRDPALRGIREVATLVYALRRDDLFAALPLVGRDNRQGEYYLPDVLGILREKGERLSAVPVDLGGAMGLNSRGGLAAVARILRERIIRTHLERGVTFLDPATAYVDVEVRLGPDTVVHPMVVLEGKTRVGEGCTVGPFVRIADSTVGQGAEVTFSVVRGSRIGPRATVGPFASLRPGTVLQEGAKAGTFVEIKASRVGRGSKVPHLSYVGDAVLGRDVNIGAGTVTANYDGFTKHRTVIGDGAHIGSDTMLVAPVRVGRNAWTGAGSTITEDVPDGALALERSEQRIVPGYDARKRAERAGVEAGAGGAPRAEGGPGARRARAGAVRSGRGLGGGGAGDVSRRGGRGRG